MDIRDILQERGKTADKMRALSQQAGGRSFTAKEQADYDSLNTRQLALKNQADRATDLLEIDGQLGAPAPGRGLAISQHAGTGKQRMFAKGQSIARAIAAEPPEPGVTLGHVMAHMIGAPVSPAVRNALETGSQADGGYLVPTSLWAYYIDALRSRSVVAQAGARFLPMESGKVTIAVVDTDPQFNWRSENSEVVLADPQFDARVLEAKSCAARFIASRELVDDSPNLPELLFNVLVSAGAAAIDAAVLNGAGGNAPTGLLNIAAIPSLSASTASPDNGAALTNYGQILDLLELIYANNGADPRSLIMSPREWRTLVGLEDQDSNPRRMPSVLLPVNDRAELFGTQWLQTTTMPVDMEVGSSSNAAAILAGDFSKVIVGVRQQLRLEVLREAHASHLQVGFLASQRVDVAVEQAAHFAKLVGIVPA